jgi:hypothetical protein
VYYNWFKFDKRCLREHLLEEICKGLRVWAAGLNSLTTIGPYMAHRFSWALFKLNNFRIFVCLLRMIAQNVAELFNLNSGVRVRVRASRAKDVSRGFLMGLENV